MSNPASSAVPTPKRMSSHPDRVDEEGEGEGNENGGSGQRKRDNLDQAERGVSMKAITRGKDLGGQGGQAKSSARVDDAYGETTPLAQTRTSGDGDGNSDRGVDRARARLPSNASAAAGADASTDNRTRRRSRGDSVVDRIRNSISSREHNDAQSLRGEPVGYEVRHRDGDEDLDDGVVGMLDVVDPEVSTGMLGLSPCLLVSSFPSCSFHLNLCKRIEKKANLA